MKRKEKKYVTLNVIFWKLLKIICIIFCFDIAITKPGKTIIKSSFSFNFSKIPNFSVRFYNTCRLLNLALNENFPKYSD